MVNTAAAFYSALIHFIVVATYTVFDLNVGYMFRNSGFGVQLDVTNIFDNSYQSFVGVPYFGRYSMLRFIYHTGF